MRHYSTLVLPNLSVMQTFPKDILSISFQTLLELQGGPRVSFRFPFKIHPKGCFRFPFQFCWICTDFLRTPFLIPRGSFVDLQGFPLHFLSRIRTDLQGYLEQFPSRSIRGAREFPRIFLWASFLLPFGLQGCPKDVLQDFYRISFNNFLWISFRFPFIIIGCGPRKPSPEAPTCPPHSTPQAQLNSTKTS